MATSDEKSAAQILAGTSLAQGMNEEDLKELLASSEVTLRTYPKGAIVFHDGDMPHSLYILLKGEVHILKDTDSGRQIFISEIDRPGDMFGEVYEVLQRPYDMYVRAVTEVKLLEVSSHLFTLDIGDKPRRSALIVQKNLMKIFAGKAYGMHTKLKILASGTLREKIVRYLYPHVDAEGHVTLTVSRAFIAAYLAVSRPSLSRELGAMQRDGIIQATGRNIRITVSVRNDKTGLSNEVNLRPTALFLCNVGELPCAAGACRYAAVFIPVRRAKLLDELHVLGDRRARGREHIAGDGRGCAREERRCTVLGKEFAPRTETDVRRRIDEAEDCDCPQNLIA